jgi:MoxR-like ATPase
VFKANSAVLNSLLTILNERLFDNGAERLPVPLLCLVRCRMLLCELERIAVLHLNDAPRLRQVGASNELPESEELDALYDRFLLRYPVSQARTPASARAGLTPTRRLG